MAESVPPSGEITMLLQNWGSGDVAALAEAVSLAYGDLHSLAVSYLRRNGGARTLQATSLVNELYLRLVRQQTVRFEDRHRFYAFAAMLMRRILVDEARRRCADKRPDSNAERVPLHEEMAWVNAANEEMLALDAAIEELQALDQRKARVTELRYLLGCTTEETAEILHVSSATVERDLQFAKAWLFRRLCPETGAPHVKA